jgi:DNA mismatch repair ATPase MutS
MEQQPSQQADQEPAEIVTLALWPSPNTALTGIALLVEPSLTMALGSVPMALKETCELVFPQLQPAMLVLPTSASTSDALPNFSANEVGIHHLRAAEFSLDTAFSRLISIDYAVLNGYTHSPQEKLTALLAVLGMSGQQPLRSVGNFNKPTRQFATAGSSMEPAEVAALRAGAGLLGFVLRRMQGLVISSLVRYAPPEAGMHIGRETLHALSILPPPNTNSATTLSIEHMFLRAIVTMPGRRLLKAWMLRPSCKLEVLQERLDAVECLYADPSLLATLRKAMRPIKDGPALIGRIIALRGTSQDWLGLLTTIDGLAHVAALPGVPLLDRVAGTPAVSATAELATLLREVLDITETRRQNRPVLRAGVSADLDALRAMFNALDGFLDSEADAAFALLQSEARELAQGMNQFFVTWTANLGFHISTILPQGFRVEDGVPDALGRPVFSDGAYTHFKNSRMDTLDSEVGDLHRQITDVQAALVLRLVDAIKTRAEAIITLAGLVAQLDVLAAFAQVSMSM